MSLFDRDIHHILASQVNPSLLRILPRFFSVVKFAINKLYTNSTKIKWVFVLQLLFIGNLTYADVDYSEDFSQVRQRIQELTTVVGTFYSEFTSQLVSSGLFGMMYNQEGDSNIRLRNVNTQLNNILLDLGNIKLYLQRQTNSVDYTSAINAISNSLHIIDNDILVGLGNVTNSLNSTAFQIESVTNLLSSINTTALSLGEYYQVFCESYYKNTGNSVVNLPLSGIADDYFNTIIRAFTECISRLGSLNNYQNSILTKLNKINDLPEDLSDIYNILEDIYNDIPDNNFVSISNNLSAIQSSLSTMISQLGTNNSWLHALSLDLSDVLLELNFANSYTLNCLDSITNLVSKIDYNIGNIGSSVTNFYLQSLLYGNSVLSGIDEFPDVYDYFLEHSDYFSSGVITPQYYTKGIDGASFRSSSIEYFLTFGDYLFSFYDSLLPSISSLNNYQYYNGTILTNIAQHTEFIQNILSQEIYTNLLKQVSWQERIFNAVTNLSLVVSNDFPEIDMAWTNDLQSYVLDATNTFSIFRRQYIFDDTPALQGVSDVNDPSTYYSYLTNYYVNIVNPPPSVGHTFTRTNWFNRIEILLASLVFSSSGTNLMTNDVSKIESAEDLVTSAETSFNELTTKNATFISKFGTNLQKLFDHIGLFTATVGSITAPPNTVLISADLDGATGGGESSPFSTSIEYKISSSDSDWSEIKELIRSITGLCWSVFGFWFVIKYLVFVSEIIAFLTGFLVSAIGDLKSS